VKKIGQKGKKMIPSRRLNVILFVVICLLVGVNGAVFSFKFWGPPIVQAWDDYWKEKLNKPAEKAGDRTISDCLKVSDFYSVHLTTYFLADSSEYAGVSTNDLKKYAEYCDRLPEPGRLIFAITLMEKEVRKDQLSLSFYEYDNAGELKLLNSLPPKNYPSGMISMDGIAAHRGKYLLKLAFGEGKSKEDIIEMPIQVGK